MAESALRNKTALAHELKRSVKGEASKRIKLVYITKPEAYDIMWQKLESYYEDVCASVQAALDDLHILRPVAGDDFRGLVELVDVVESAYSQLSELGNLNILTIRDVDRITELLPNHLTTSITPAEKIRPFVSFMKFLDTEKEAVSRMAENQPKARFKKHLIMLANKVQRNITSARFHLTEKTILTTQRKNVKNFKSSL